MATAVESKSKRLKVLMVDSLVTNDYTFWLSESLSLADANVVFVTTANHAGKQEDAYELLPVSPPKGAGHNKIMKLFQYIYYLIWLFFYVLRSRPDVVHFQFFRRDRMECVYFPLLRLVTNNLIFTAHDIVPHENNTPMDYRLRGLVYRTSTKIIVHTPSLKKRLLESFTIDPHKIHVVPHPQPPPNEDDEKPEISKEMAREKLNIAPDEQVLLFFGTIREYKGLDILFEAFEIAKPSLPKLKLVVAGRPHTTELKDQYMEQLSQMSVADSVICRLEFIPNEEVDYYFLSADVIAMPYRNIYFSGVLHTAFSHSLPILATDVGSFGDFIEQGVNGYITEPNSAEAFAKIITLAFQDSDALIKMGQKSYELHQNEPDWKEIGQLTKDVYEM